MTIDRVFVAGAGFMGHGIAQVHAAAGKEVTLYEPDLARAAAGRARIVGNLERAAAKGRITPEEQAATVGRISVTDDLAAVADADLVIEAVFEDLDVKTALLAETRSSRVPGHHLRHEHLVDLHRAAGRVRAGGSSDPVPGDALLQPRAGDAAHRAHSSARHVRSDGGSDPRSRGASSTSR